ncbi:MAG: ATP-binding cassette domain-containing protein [Clostridiaceae bacterium]|jgi:peptide/nickel transport system ATP-binding protein|nr:ATP-binding cassette domain-containing protein [Clostridiaceae bacterium]
MKEKLQNAAAFIRKRAIRFGKAVKKFFTDIFGSDSGYISRKTEKEISDYNRKEIKRLEKEKRRKLSPEDYRTEMQNPDNIAEFDDLKTYFYTDRGTVKAVDGVSFSIPKGVTVGIVGESGCGKSVTAMSLMRLIQGPLGQITGGEIRFAGRDGYTYDMVKIPTKDLYRIRGKEIAMIFQEPMTSLNPVFTIGNQIDEVLITHLDMNKHEARKRSIELLTQVGIPMPEQICDRYPHELSGGMRQRVMITIALACQPRLIIADEPTTALDVTIQAQILDLLRRIKTQFDGSIMLITHDLGVIAEMAEFVVLMYAGKIIETGTVDEIFYNPLHPYTIGLQRSKPVIDSGKERLYSIPGNVPNPINMPPYCYFYDRCRFRTPECKKGYPPFVQLTETHGTACWLHQRSADADYENAGTFTTDAATTDTVNTNTANMPNGGENF